MATLDKNQTIIGDTMSSEENVLLRERIPSQRAQMLDPFEVAAAYVSTPQPRVLGELIAGVEREILGLR